MATSNHANYQFINCTIDDGVATITLNRPERRNALSQALRDELQQALDAIRVDPDVCAVVLTGAGGHFSSGGDISTMSNETTAIAGWQRMQGAHRLVSDLVHFNRPIIMALDGSVYGAGMGIALCGDFVLATPRARFSMAFVRVGLVPDFGVFYTLPRMVGVQRAKELIYSGREIDAAEAKDIGIVYELVEPDALLQRAQALAASFRHASPVGVAMTKQALDASMHSDLPAMLSMEAMAQGIAMSGEQHHEAVTRFMSKQAPRFQWPAKQK